MANPNIKAVLFDLDGTLATSVSSLKESYYKFLNSVGVAGSEQEFEELIGPSLLEVTRLLKDRHALTGNIEQLYEQYLNIVNEDYSKDVTPQAGVQPLLAWLGEQSIRSALVTSAPRQIAVSFLERFQLQQYFSAIVTGDDVTESKPSPQPYRQALELLSLNSAQGIAVEDSPKGIQSAKQAGLVVLGLCNDGSDAADDLKESGAAATINCLSQVRDFLEN